ncbi:ATP synthase F1 subunit gamma [Candidatus Marinimicrobia bacterium]|jgi:F-type H+-transporting ATPase subunit gamma|nr:ATP synthase F1 subunit gamma [bacterium]MDA7641893.1 ATP synthase F1 subunit gamma [Candidatus Neomarinimicrobiota bacterium]MDA7685895.1 ATP synthase F1 subunit gamma [Candidatus Neomarinimicrobiota bacterium]MDA9841041.1 ATP synthase F1 subunit gamma [Candidatus Neomarinimicrobiota bacterium]MDB3979958.1 ATP synthase F1 subunit gamma [Candidatus Neomarinimicrobiota bacterium]
MANLKSLQERIKSVSSIQQVTKAMKMVAAAKVKKAQDKMEISRPYSKNTQDMICRILPQVSNDNIALVSKRKVSKTALIIITSDRGFAGSFNSSVIRLAEKEIEKLGKDKVQLFCLGKKASEYFSKRNYNVVQSFYDFWKDMTFDTASDIAETFIAAFKNHEVDEVNVIYNRFKTLASQDLLMEKVLPIDFTKDYNPKDYNYDYEPNKESIVKSLLPKHLKVQMWQQMLESYSSEEAARMIAMDNATENAKEIIKELKLEFNKARQAAITTEMLEIVGGAEALVD